MACPFQSPVQIYQEGVESKMSKAALKIKKVFMFTDIVLTVKGRI
jgi:hypothetical protein